MMQGVGEAARRARSARRLIAIILAVLLVCIVLVLYVFNGFLGQYRDNIIEESAAHLTEIIYQTKLYIEEKVNNDWQTMYSIQNSVNMYSQDDMQDIFTLLRSERDVWKISDILMYTENGYCVGADMQVFPNDDASETIYNARKYGSLISIMQSTVKYTMPVDTPLTLNGSRIAAVSILQELDSFIDNMNFTSFGGAAYIYLTQRNGAIISHSTHPSASNAYNIFALLEAGSHTCLTHKNHTMQNAFDYESPCTFLLPGEGGDEYAVTIPIQTHGVELCLVYMVPESIVNRTMNEFTDYVLNVTIVCIGIFTVFAMCAFLYLYRVRKQAFDSALIARDRMFDLLVANTNNAFAMFTADRPEPIYMSSNIHNIIGDRYLWIEHNQGAYRMRTASGDESEATRQINQDLADWDGASEFVSSFVPYRVNGLTRYYVLRIYPVAEETSEYIVIAQDVTREREREAALKDALVMADSANNAKTRFLANMSHDIRTPMNAIVNMVAFARENDTDRVKQREYLQTIEDSAHHLLDLINDILDMSRIESGKTAVASDPIDLHKCLTSVTEIITPLCADKRLELTTDYECVAGEHLLGDSLKLTQVLINLLNNAVKFTPSGGHIRFTAKQMHSLKDDTASIRFTVRDDGIGIDSENLNRIFEPFARIENNAIRMIEGTGLGLSISQSYVTAMGGSIACESTLGEGSTFTVELPFMRDMAALPKERARVEDTEEVSFAGKRALICEDNEINQRIAQMLLERIGMTVDCVSDGSEGVKRFTASAPDEYDVIYMDIQMPVMNGYEATSAIRSSSHPRASTIPIIAMTANVFTEDIEQARAAGMNEHVGKPISLTELKQATARALN